MGILSEALSASAVKATEAHRLASRDFHSRRDRMRDTYFFFFQAEDGIRDVAVTGVQTCALPISPGPSYPVALKGRAWILRDSFDIARLETDLIAPVPQIKLVADHTAIEYGPVRFHIPDAEMWLPQSAEVYYDWRGKRIHRRHSFSHYLLFVVDDNQRNAEPKPQNL